MQKNISKPQKRKASSHIGEQLHPSLSERRAEKNGNVVLVSVIIVAVLGCGIAFFLAGVNALWLITGAVIGGIIGYLFGAQIVKSLSKK